MKTYSLFIIKPGFADKTKEIFNILKENDIRIESALSSIIPKSQIEQHYAEHLGKPFYNTLVSYMTTGNVGGIIKFNPKCVIMIASSNIQEETEEQFIERSRKVVKEILRPAIALKRENFFEYTEEEFKEIIATANGIHASDSPQSAKREIENFFGKCQKISNREM